MEPDPSTLLFTNLQLLGMDVLAMEGKYHIPFNKEMFNLPNKAGSEAVLHFLFNRLNPVLFKEQFRDCWPVVDRKTELQFRKVCNTWLSRIHADDPDAHIPRINASLLLSPGGRKFIHLLYRFSTHVLIQTMTREHGFKMQDALVYHVLNQAMSAYGDVMCIALDDSCQQALSLSFEQLHLTVAANRKWRESADEILKSYRRLSRACRDLENEKRQLVNTLAENAQKQGLSLPAKRTTSMFDSDQDVYSKTRGKRMEKARSQWKELSAFSHEMEEKRRILKSVLDPVSEKPAVNGSELGVRIPNSLLQDFQKEIQAQEIDNVYIGGCLNLESVALLWNMCLRKYKEQMDTGQLPDLTDEIPAIKSQVHQHHAYLQTAQKTRDEIKNLTLPEIQEEIAKLHEKIKSLSIAMRHHDESNNGLGLIAPTPPLAFPSRSSQSGDTPTGPALTWQSKKDTPNAISTLIGNVKQSVHQNAKHMNVSKDLHLLSGLQALRKSAKITSASKLQLDKSTTKRTHPGTKPSSNYKEHNRAVQPRAPTTGKYFDQKKEKPRSTIFTPTTKKQTAEDTLANLIVDSVLDDHVGDRDWGSPELASQGDGSFPGTHDLDQAAFVSKDLLARTPHKGALPSGSVPTAANNSSPSEDLVHQSAQDESQRSRSIFHSPLWEQTSLSPSINKTSSVQTMDLFSPVASLSCESQLDPAASISHASLQSPFVSEALSLSFSLPAQDTNHNSKTPVLKREVNRDSSSKVKVSNTNSERSNDLFKLQENRKEPSFSYKGLTRFPGDGQTSHESLASSNSDDGATELGSMSKDSLFEPILSNNQASQLLTLTDDPVSTPEGTVHYGGESNSPLHAENVPESSNSAFGITGDRASRESIRMDLKLSSLDFHNISSRDLLDLDSGDEFMQGLDDSFSPAKRGIVLESGRSPRGEPSEVTRGRSNFVFEPFDTTANEPAYPRVDNTNTPVKSHNSLSVSQSGNDVLSRMALLQQRVASIVNRSSEEDD